MEDDIKGEVDLTLFRKKKIDGPFFTNWS